MGKEGIEMGLGIRMGMRMDRMRCEREWME